MDDHLRSIDATPPNTKLKIGPKRTRRKYLIMLLITCTVLLASSVIYFANSLKPVDPNSDASVRVVVHKGETASDIASLLQKEGLIRSASVFQLYTEISGNRSRLQAGGYVLKKSHSIPDIVSHLVSGKTDEILVTVLPGLTLEQLADSGVKGSLAQQGFTKQEIKTAFSKVYEGGIFNGMPAGSSLEGYIFPETYKISASGNLDTLLKMSFDEFSSKIKSLNLEAKLGQQGLSLRQGIILASIVQKEVSDPKEQRQVAQVFLKRLKDKMVLGSDVTFLYIANKEGRAPSVNDDSPYNTRKNAGLPPGPISNFNLSALQAVAEPMSGDYLYFVAGDDGTTHYAHTEAQHLDNVARYCKALCH